jgi:hypothetical protein
MPDVLNRRHLLCVVGFHLRAQFCQFTQNARRGGRLFRLFRLFWFFRLGWRGDGFLPSPCFVKLLWCALLQPQEWVAEDSQNTQYPSVQQKSASAPCGNQSARFAVAVGRTTHPFQNKRTMKAVVLRQ